MFQIVYQEIFQFNIKITSTQVSALFKKNIFNVI